MRVTLQAQYAVFPALIMVKEDNGRTLVTPIPLPSAAVVLRLTLYWLIIALRQRVSSLLPRVGTVLAGRTVEVSCKLALGLVMGAYLGRALAWGLLRL
jgi:hypothetical protein